MSEGRNAASYGLDVSSVSSLTAPASPDTLLCSSTTISSTFNKVPHTSVTLVSSETKKKFSFAIQT